MRVFTFDRLEVTISELIASHFSGLPINQRLLERYQGVLSHANSLLRPIAGVELITNYMFKELTHSIRGTSPPTFNKLVPLQKSSVSAYLIFCTIGPRLDEEVGQLCAEDDVSRAFILDAVGSIAVVKFARYLELLLEKEAALQGHKCSVPVMPGSRGIDLIVNRALVEMVDIKQIGITLSEHCIMKPLKTLAMILGVGGPRLTARSAGHDCSECFSEKSCYLKHIRHSIDHSPSLADSLKNLKMLSFDENCL